jgi:hypothetical protein
VFRLCLCNCGPIVHTPDDNRVNTNRGGMILTEENRRTWIKTCPIATLSTKNAECNNLGPNQGLRSVKRTTNRQRKARFIIGFIALGSLGWAGDVARIEKIKKNLVGKTRRK